MSEYKNGYKACENDIVAWLSKQTPVPVCQGLALQIRRGNHHHAACEPTRNVEIPLKLHEATPHAIMSLRMSLEMEGAQLCVSDDSETLVAVPIFPLLEYGIKRLHAAILEMPNIASAGEPVQFSGTPVVFTDTPK